MFTARLGDKVRIARNMYTVDGFLEEGTIVKVDEVGFPDKDMRVTDPLGRIWYLDYQDVEKYEEKSKKVNRKKS